MYLVMCMSFIPLRTSGIRSKPAAAVGVILGTFQDGAAERLFWDALVRIT